MRVFVEGILRFGMPPSLSAFMVRVKPSSQAAARKVLAGAMGGVNMDLAADGGDDAEEFFPYVSSSFIPFTANRS